MELIGIQTDIAWEERDTNFARVREMLAAARIAPGSLLVLPELFAVGFSFDIAKVADRRRETELFLLDLARQYQSYVIGGAARLHPSGAANEALVAGPEGRLLGNYRKMHPFSLAGEGEHYAAGAEVRVFTCGEFLIAPSICYDLRFPEWYRSAVELGAEVLVVIANWPIVRVDHWMTLLKARAIENQAYVIGVNRVGQDPLHVYNGKSLIVDPRGQMIAEASSAPMLLRAHAELRVVADWRMAFPALADRREDWAAGESGIENGPSESAKEMPARRNV